MKKICYLSIFFLVGLAACFVAACSDDEITGSSATVEVIGNPVTEITIANATDGAITLTNVGATVTAQVAATPSNADDAGYYVYTSSDDKIFTVTQEGVITATGYGEATLSVAAQNNTAVSAACKVLVVGTRITAIEFDSAAYSFIRTSTSALTTLAQHITITPAEASVKTLKYTSSNPEVAIVSDDGDVFALWDGATTITAEALDGSGVSAACTFTVSIAQVTSIKFNAPGATTPYFQFHLNDRDNRNYNHGGPSSEAQISANESPLTKGATTSSNVQYAPSDALVNTLEYESLTPSVLTVEVNASNQLILTPVAAGTATVRASATDGYGASVEQEFYVHHMLDQSSWKIVEASAHGTKVGSGTEDTEVAYWDIEEALHGGVGTLLKPGASAAGLDDVAGTELPLPTDSAYFVIDMQTPTNFDYFSAQWNRSMETGSRVRYFTLYGSNDNVTFTSLEVVDKGSNWQYRRALNQVYTYRYVKVKVINAASYNYNPNATSGNTAIKYWHICNLNFGVLP
ncbi:MAG: Ig-like domain-containing protein [Prevotellaceae bacterium]|jgi:uncharacterized protein YjdB|nr:Ig-like domain-containing protein [Prevotellaceae bacterium]